MNEVEAKDYLKNHLNFTILDIERLETFKSQLLDFNSNYNLISDNTLSFIWTRHVLDSAQLLSLINTKSNASLIDLGSGAGFPGLIISIFNKNPEFHVKLYEKSPVKRKFLNILQDISQQEACFFHILRLDLVYLRISSTCCWVCFCYS